MILRQFVPHAGRCAAVYHPASRCVLVKRAYATEVEQNEAFLARRFDEAAAIATGAAIPQSSADDPNGQPRRVRRRRLPRVDPVVQNYLGSQHISATTGNYGSQHVAYYQPNAVLANPPRPADVTLELLLASQAHLGHSTSLWNPANSRYIFGIREGIHIISLDVTAAHLRRAARVVSGVAERGGIILFVGTRPGFDRCVVRAAELSGGCHLFERWTPGSITNGQQILGKCRMKVVDEFDRELSGFQEQLLERSVLKPDLVVMLNPLENRVLLQECAQSHIPTIGIIDTDANPSWVTYPIPANDDSIRCVQVIAGVLGRAGEEGLRRRRDAASRGVLTYLATQGLVLPSDWEEKHDIEEAQKPGISNINQEGRLPTKVFPAVPSAPAISDSDERLSAIIKQLNEAEIQSVEEGTMTRKQLETIAAQGRLSPEDAAILADAIDEDNTPLSDDMDDGQLETPDNAHSRENISDKSSVGREDHMAQQQRSRQPTQEQLDAIISQLNDEELQALQAGTFSQAELDKIAGEGRLTDEEVHLLTNAMKDTNEDSFAEESDNEVSAVEETVIGEVNGRNMHASSYSGEEVVGEEYDAEDDQDSQISRIDWKPNSRPYAREEHDIQNDQDSYTSRMGVQPNLPAYADKNTERAAVEKENLERDAAEDAQPEVVRMGQTSGRDSARRPSDQHQKAADAQNLTGTSSSGR